MRRQKQMDDATVEPEREVCAQLCPGDDSDREGDRAAEAVVVKAADDEVGDRSGSGHDREHEMRGCRGDVGREAEGSDEQRDVDHAAADAQEAREEADSETVEGAAYDRDPVFVGLARSIDDHAQLEMTARFPERPALPGDQPDGEGRENDAHDRVEDLPGDHAHQEGAADRAGNRCEREDDAAAVVDATLARVRGAATRSVEEDDREADGGQRLRLLVRVEKQQDRGEDETAARADHRPERADGETDQNQQTRRLGCERHRL